jgi:hypothetical protein
LPLHVEIVVKISRGMTLEKRFFSKTELVQKFTTSKWIIHPHIPNIQYQKSKGFLSECHWDIMVVFL